MIFLFKIIALALLFERKNQALVRKVGKGRSATAHRSLSCGGIKAGQ
jgi:hypothetical protein